MSVFNYTRTVQLKQDTGPYCTSLGSMYAEMPVLTLLNPEWETEDRLLAQVLLEFEFKFGISVFKEGCERAQHKGWLPQHSKTSFRPSLIEDQIITSFEAILNE